MNTPAGSSSVGSPNTIRFQHGTHHDMLRRRVTDSDRGRSTSVEICAFFNERQQETRYASRRLLRSPAFTAATVLTLALAIGPIASIFAVVCGVVLNPLPY